MKCPNCQTDNRDSAQFCEKCGNLLNLTTESFNKRVEQIILRYSTEIADNRIFFKPNIPHKKLLNAINAYANAIEEKNILVLLDNTAFKSARDGFLLTASELYARNQSNNPQHIQLADIRNVTLEGSFNYKICFNNIKLEAQMVDKKSLVLFTQMLNEISTNSLRRIDDLPQIDSTLRQIKPIALRKTPEEADKIIVSMLEQGKEIEESESELVKNGWTREEAQRFIATGKTESTPIDNNTNKKHLPTVDTQGAIKPKAHEEIKPIIIVSQGDAEQNNTAKKENGSGIDRILWGTTLAVAGFFIWRNSDSSGLRSYLWNIDSNILLIGGWAAMLFGLVTAASGISSAFKNKGKK